MANNILEMKKLINHHIEIRQKARIEKEMQDFNHFICYWMLVAVVVIALFGMGIWLI